MKPLAVYIHWPFCVSKCPYCDFNSRVLDTAADEKNWAVAYGRELESVAERLGPRTVSSVYFGGGTPSLMKPETVAAVLQTVRRLWPVAEACEITLEANPSSAETEKFKAFHAAGVNRLSLGVQSFDEDSLRFLGRAHDAAAARRAIEAAASVFDRFSFDLIYARAGQTAASWAAELREALTFAPRHLSLYQLTIEPRTPFFKRAATETLQTDDDTAVELFEQTQALLEAAGLPAYEISNHAQAGQESRHNLAYWHYDDYIGIGPGAHGRFVATDGTRRATANLPRPEAWLTAVQATGAGAESDEPVSQAEALTEAVMMGLRLAEGIDLADLAGKTGGLLPEESRVAALVAQGMLTNAAGRLTATPHGRQRLNAVLDRLLA